jgi:hypothetical protein
LRASFPALLVLVVLAGLFASIASAATEPLTAQVSGATALAPGQIGEYNLTIEGGPTEPVNYTVTYYITGTNTTGGLPLSSSPATATGTHPAFSLNVTAPSQEQGITLVIVVQATPKGAPEENTTTNYAIVVIKPIVLTATFHNDSPTASVNVTIRWYVDATLVGTTTLGRIAGNGDATVSFNYLPVGLGAGQHTVRVEADLYHNGVINPSLGEVVTSTIFYNQVQQPAVGWTLLLGIGVFVPVFLVVVALRRRGQT